MKTSDVFAGRDISDKEQAREVDTDYEGRPPRLALSEEEESKQFHAHFPTFETR